MLIISYDLSSSDNDVLTRCKILSFIQDTFINLLQEHGSHLQLLDNINQSHKVWIHNILLNHNNEYHSGNWIAMVFKFKIHGHRVLAIWKVDPGWHDSSSCSVVAAVLRYGQIAGKTRLHWTRSVYVMLEIVTGQNKTLDSILVPGNFIFSFYLQNPPSFSRDITKATSKSVYLPPTTSHFAFPTKSP